MVKSGNSRILRFAAALIVGAALGAVVGKYIQKKTDLQARGEPPVAGEDSTNEAQSARKGAAWEYAEACRDGNWDRVVALLGWVQERLAYVQEREGAEAVAEERARLALELGQRRLEDNRLLDEGVEDVYVFTPGVALEFVRADAGRDDLEAPVARRTWVKVIFPGRERALLDRDGVPIRSLVVGINVSPDGFVLKANVLGNLDVDWESIRYDWPGRR